MMSYECFEGLMNILKTFWENMCKLEESLGVQFENNWMMDHFDRIVEAITNEFEGSGIDEKIGPIILYWMFDMECGKENHIIPYKGVNHEVKDLEELYNLLVSIRDLRIIEEENL
jgi:hypothetical protein